MIWVGTCRWDLKSSYPFLYQILPENETHFYTRATNFKQNLPKVSHYFPKLVSFQANLGNFCVRLMKLGLFSRQFLKIWPMFIPVFALNKGVIVIPGCWFWDPFQRQVPRIDLCTKKPPPNMRKNERKYRMRNLIIMKCPFFAHPMLRVWLHLPRGALNFFQVGVQPNFPKCRAWELIFACERRILWTEVFKFGG